MTVAYDEALAAIYKITDAIELSDVANRAQAHAITLSRRSFRLHQEVEFEARGELWKGRVKSVGPKNILVAATFPRTMQWRVNAHLVRHAACPASEKPTESLPVPPMVLPQGFIPTPPGRYESRF